MAIINRNGVWNAPQLYETGGVNLASITEFGYVPTTATNSCCTGAVIDFTDCSPGQLMHTSLDIIWSGFDKSNTNGTFGIWMQGSRYEVASSSWKWNGGSNVYSKIYNNSSTFTNLVLSKTSGSAHIEFDFTLASDMPTTYSKQYFGIRSDYSNGTGRVDVKNLVVSPVEQQGSPVHVSKEYTAADEFYEI